MGTGAKTGDHRSGQLHGSREPAVPPAKTERATAAAMTGSLAIFAAIRRASSRVGRQNFVASARRTRYCPTSVERTVRCELVNDADEPSAAPVGCLQVVASGKASGVNRYRLDNSLHTARATL